MENGVGLVLCSILNLIGILVVKEGDLVHQFLLFDSWMQKFIQTGSHHFDFLHFWQEGILPDVLEYLTAAYHLFLEGVWLLLQFLFLRTVLWKSLLCITFWDTLELTIVALIEKFILFLFSVLLLKKLKNEVHSGFLFGHFGVEAKFGRSSKVCLPAGKHGIAIDIVQPFLNCPNLSNKLF